MILLNVKKTKGKKKGGKKCYGLDKHFGSVWIPRSFLFFRGWGVGGASDYAPSSSFPTSLRVGLDTSSQEFFCIFFCLACDYSPSSLWIKISHNAKPRVSQDQFISQ